MKKITNIVLLALIVVSAVTVALWLFGGDVNGMTAKVSPMLTMAAGLLGLAVLLLVGMTVMNMGKGRSNSKLGLFVFGGLAVVAVILYFTIAKDVVVIGADGTVFDSIFELKVTDTMLYVTYFALGVTVISLLWGVVRKALK